MPALTDVRVDWVSLVDRPAVRDAVQQTEPARFLLWKRDPTNPHQEDPMTPEEKAALEKAQADLTTALATIETQKAELAELKKSTEPAEPAPINKDELPEPVRAALEKAENERQAMATRLQKAEDLAKSERDARVTREFVTKAEAYRALVVKADEFGPVLKEASEKLAPETFAALEQVLKAADEQIHASDLFKEQGRAREAAKGGTALAEVAQKAQEIRKADTTVTEAAAMQQVFKADPALAARYQDELRAA